MPSVRANVRGEILVWARETAGYQQDEAAHKLKITPERLSGWEQEESKPTITQLRAMARLYKRPLAVFYLTRVPEGFAVMRDFRRLPGEGLRRFSPELTLEIRDAQQRRELMLDLYSEIDERPRRFEFTAALDANPEEVGTRIRNALGVTHEIQSAWRSARVAFNTWRERIESVGVIVFQMDRPAASEASGFALSADVLPLVAINRNDVFSRRTFSLLHEFAHLALRASGVSDSDVETTRPPEELRTEVFCNAVAAAALMPREDFLREQIITNRTAAPHQWSDEEISALTRQYSVSREAIVRRMLTFGRATEAFYREKRQQYERERQERRDRERAKMAEQEFRRNPARDTLTNNGAPYVRLVLNSYYRDRITLSEVASFLRIRLKHLPRLQQYVGMG